MLDVGSNIKLNKLTDRTKFFPKIAINRSVGLTLVELAESRS